MSPRLNCYTIVKYLNQSSVVTAVFTACTKFTHWKRCKYFFQYICLCQHKSQQPKRHLPLLRIYLILRDQYEWILFLLIPQIHDQQQHKKQQHRIKITLSTANTMAPTTSAKSELTAKRRRTTVTTSTTKQRQQN